MKTILIVEDDKSLNRGIALTLKQDDIEILQAYDLKNARLILNDIQPELIILDINLPNGNGLDFCGEIRNSSNVPIIFLTANDMEIHIVTGFEMGGDDYITKPFSLMVLRARVMAFLKRKGSDTENELIIGNLRFDFAKMDFIKDGKPIQLSMTELKLLKKLIANKGTILTREQLMESVWANESEFVDENALTVTVKRLRGKIEDNPSAPVFIKTVYGLGYIWTGGMKKC